MNEIWEGWFTCLVDDCQERIYLLRQEPGPPDWQAQVLHDHEAGGWIVAVFPHRKGQRYWAEVKRMRQAIADQRKEAKALALQRKNSRLESSSQKYYRDLARESISEQPGLPSSVPSTTTPMPAPATTTPSDSSSATPARSTETSSTSSSTPKASAFLRRLKKSSGGSDE